MLLETIWLLDEWSFGYDIVMDRSAGGNDSGLKLLKLQFNPFKKPTILVHKS